MSHYTYFLILTFSLSVPLLFSFERRIRYIARWKEYLPAVTLTALLFLIKDAYFTYLGIWGFSESFIIGIKLYTLPLEEILFFFVIPYSSLFLHEINKKYSIITFSPNLTNTVTFSLLLLQTFILIFYTDKTYTWVNALVFVLIISSTVIVKKISLLRSFLGSFLGILIPFIIVNGILTGMFNLGGNPVVWYDSNEILGLRIGSIPIEDVFYGFAMLFLPVIIESTDTYQSLLARLKK